MLGSCKNQNFPLEFFFTENSKNTVKNCPLICYFVALNKQVKYSKQSSKSLVNAVSAKQSFRWWKHSVMEKAFGENKIAFGEKSIR
jgi:hypothetical protein